MKIYAALFAASMTVARLCFAEEVSITEITYYRGFIAHQKIAMILEERNNEVAGKYAYTKYNTPISLAGSYDGDILSIREIHEGVETAKINARNNGVALEGSWNSHDSYNLYATPTSRSYRHVVDNISADTISITINIKEKPDQVLPIGTLSKPLSITFEDFTFDGYSDMRILELEGGGNSSYRYFEYDPDTRRYKKAKPEINNIVNPLVIHEKKLVTGLIKDGCCNYSATIVSANEIRKAEYDYLTSTGKEKVSNKSSGLITESFLSKENFEKNYLGLIQDGNFQ